MHRYRPLSLLGALLALTLSAPVWGDTLLFDYVGFDYEDPNPDPGQFGEVGSGYVGIGTVPGLFAPLTADTTQYEYTYVVNGLTPVSQQLVGTYLIVNYSTGTLSIYEDSKSSGTAAHYGTSPPNAVAPSTFTDGTLFLTGTLTGFQFVFNTASNSGSYDAQYAITGGSQLLNFPVSQRDGWTFAGASGNATNVPDGYQHQVDGQNFLGPPVAARQKSWGQIKATYR